MLLCAWLFVRIHAIASLYLSHLKIQITDVTSMPPAAGGGGDGGDCGDGADDGRGEGEFFFGRTLEIVSRRSPL